MTIKPPTIHNIYIAADTVIHTIKYGENAKADWIPKDEFTELTKNIIEVTLKGKGIVWDNNKVYL